MMHSPSVHMNSASLQRLAIRSCGTLQSRSSLPSSQSTSPSHRQFSLMHSVLLTHWNWLSLHTRESTTRNNTYGLHVHYISTCIHCSYRSTSKCTDVRVHVPVYEYMYRWTCTCTGVRVHVPVYVYMYRCTCTCTGVRVHVPVCTCILAH